MKREFLQLAMGFIMLFALAFANRLLIGNEAVVINVGAKAGKEPVIVVDPGHGGVDPGMLGVNNTVEKEINLRIATKLRDALEGQGYKVVMTRESDDGLYEEGDSNKKMADMRKRCAIIEKNQADITICIHQNSYSDERVCGGQVFYYKHSTEGAKLAGSIQNAFKEYVDATNNRKIKPNDSYYMLVHTPCPTVIVECGFITNYEEAEKLVTEEYQEMVVKAITVGVNEYLGIPNGD